MATSTKSRSLKLSDYQRLTLIRQTEAYSDTMRDLYFESLWLRERFPEKDWHRHQRTDGGADLCDGTPSDCASKARVTGRGSDG